MHQSHPFPVHGCAAPLAGGASDLREFWADPAQRVQLKPEARWEIEQGERLSAREVYAAGVARSRVYEQMLSRFERHDCKCWRAARLRWPDDGASAPVRPGCCC